MKTKSLDSLFATACFSLLNIFMLVCNFSLWGCLCVAATIAFYLIRLHFNTKIEERNCSIIPWFATYLGAFAIDSVAVLACAKDLLRTKPGFEFSASFVWAILILLASLFVAQVVLNGEPVTFRYILRYAVITAGAIGSSCLFIQWNRTPIIIFGVALAAAALLLDLLDPFHTGGGYKWLRAYLILFSLLSILYPYFACNVVNTVFNYRAEGGAPIVVYVIMAILFAVCAVQLLFIKGQKINSGNAARLYIFLSAMSLTLMLSKLVSTRYDAVFLILTLAVHILLLLGRRTDRNTQFLGFSVPVITVQYTAVSILMLLLPVMFFVGLLWEYTCIMVAIIGITFVYTASLRKTDASVPVYKTWMFWQLILTASLLFGLAVVHQQCHFAGGYVLLSLLYVVATFALGILNIENKRFKKNHSAMRIAIVVAFSLLMIFSADQLHASVTYEVDNAISQKAEMEAADVGETDTITVTVEPDEKNPFKKCYAYWLDDKETVFPINLETDAVNTLSFRDGGLCVMLEYENGAIFTDTQWFYDADYTENMVYIGTPRHE